jgi:T5SS/PEP-CTERM-associated repeat protein
MVFGLYTSIAPGGITPTGDVSPANPATWTSSTRAYIGNTGTGGVTVDDDSDLRSYYSYVGRASGSTGAVTVSGAGSTWTNSIELHVGSLGDGTLHVSDGGAVINNWNGFVGTWSGSAGAATVSGAGSTWSNSGFLYVGVYGTGTLDIINGAASNTNDGYIGQYSGSTGAVTVSGAGATWTNSSDLYVGDSGDGTLTIDDGGLVQVGGDTYASRHVGGDCTIDFDNGTLTTGGFLGATSDLSGTGTINTRGLVSDVDLLFDAAGGLTQTVMLNGPGQNIDVNLEVDGSASMGAGYGGQGSMHISDGLSVLSIHGYLGYRSGSTGAATVSGDGQRRRVNLDQFRQAFCRLFWRWHAGHC